MSSALKAVGLNCVRAPCRIGHRNEAVVHDPFADARDLLAVPGPCGDGIKTPVDEHAEACIPPPGHTRVTLRGRLGILNCGHGMS